MRLKNPLTQSSFGVACGSTGQRCWAVTGLSVSIKFSIPHCWHGMTSTLPRSYLFSSTQSMSARGLPHPGFWHADNPTARYLRWTIRRPWRGALNDLFAGVESSAVSGWDRPFSFQELDRSFEFAKRSPLGLLHRPVRRMRGRVVGDGLLSRVFISTTRRQENRAIQKPPMSKQIRKSTSTSGWASSSNLVSTRARAAKSWSNYLLCMIASHFSTRKGIIFHKQIRKSNMALTVANKKNKKISLLFFVSSGLRSAEFFLIVCFDNNYDVYIGTGNWKSLNASGRVKASTNHILILAQLLALYDYQDRKKHVIATRTIGSKSVAENQWHFIAVDWAQIAV